MSIEKKNPNLDLYKFKIAIGQEYRKHYPKKGDSWKNCPYEQLLFKLVEEILEFWKTHQRKEAQEEILDVALMCGMIWERLATTEE